MHAIRLAVVALLSLVVVGCRSAERTITSERFDGPAVSMERDNAQLRVVVQAPTPGWKVDLDQTRRESWGTAALVTMRRPDPSFVYPQMIVEQRIALRRTLAEPVRVYARVLDHNDETKGGTYRYAARSTDAQPNTQDAGGDE